jgi:hypothetical protein
VSRSRRSATSASGAGAGGSAGGPGHPVTATHRIGHPGQHVPQQPRARRAHPVLGALW